MAISKKNSMGRDGKVYHSVPEAARMLGTTTTKLKQFAVAEGLEFENFRSNGKLWISDEQIQACIARRKPNGSA